MTCTLCYKPVLQEYEHIGDIHLRKILDKKYGYPSRLDMTDIPYLKALIDAGIDSANKLVDAINKYQQIEIYLEC